MKKLLFIFILLTICVGCDQSTKYTAKHYLKGKKTISYMGDVFRLTYLENHGGFLSLGAKMSENFRHTIFVIVVPTFLAGFLLFVIRNKRMNALTIASSTLIIGGGLGNLIDRIINQGAVIDFMNVGIGSTRTGVFNMADLAIMTGTFLFVASYPRKTNKSTD